MAIPDSPTVVYIENDNSIFAPNVESSVVGIVGFADKGPTNEATLITSQAQLIDVFGLPNSNIPGQGLEGALEILETTNQVYFCRAVDSSAANASAVIPIGYPPSFTVSAASGNVAQVNIFYSSVDNAGTATTGLVSMVSSTTVNTIEKMLLNYFDASLVQDAPLFAMRDSDGTLHVASRYAGSGASLTLSSSLPDSLKLWPNLLDGTNSDEIIDIGNNYTAYGGTAVQTGASSLYCLTESIYPGTGYNLSSLRDGSIVGVSVEVDSRSIRDFLTVNMNGAQRETFLLELAPSGEASLEYVLNVTDNLNQSDVINAQILASGAAFTVPDNSADELASTRAFRPGDSGNVIALGAPRFVKLLEGTYALAGGNSGYSQVESGNSSDFTALIGTQAAKTGIYALDDDSLNISVGVVPGITAQSVQNALITLAETSQNFIAVVAPPLGLDSVQEATDWINGRGARTSPINSSYAAVYWPWVQTFNPYAGAEEWYDPAIFACRQYAYTDNVSEPWFAPAGFRRGRLTKPTDTEIILNQGDRDSLYKNNINPITKDTQAGIVIFGQKTGQRLPSALNSVNVRRLMINIRKVLLILGKPFQFQPNDEFTWEQVEDAVNPFLDDLIARRAIVEGAVRCDSTTNTPLRVDRKEMWCQITIKPTLAAETIVFQVDLTNQGATING